MTVSSHGYCSVGACDTAPGSPTLTASQLINDWTQTTLGLVGPWRSVEASKTWRHTQAWKCVLKGDFTTYPALICPLCNGYQSLSGNGVIKKKNKESQREGEREGRRGEGGERNSKVGGGEGAGKWQRGSGEETGRKRRDGEEEGRTREKIVKKIMETKEGGKWWIGQKEDKRWNNDEQKTEDGTKSTHTDAKKGRERKREELPFVQEILFCFLLNEACLSAKARQTSVALYSAVLILKLSPSASRFLFFSVFLFFLPSASVSDRGEVKWQLQFSQNHWF